MLFKSLSLLGWPAFSIWSEMKICSSWITIKKERSSSSGTKHKGKSYVGPLLVSLEFGEKQFGAFLCMPIEKYPEIFASQWLLTVALFQWSMLNFWTFYRTREIG